MTAGTVRSSTVQLSASVTKDSPATPATQTSTTVSVSSARTTARAWTRTEVTFVPVSLAMQVKQLDASLTLSLCSGV